MADKILIVDDDEDLRAELKDFFGQDYEVLEASSGESALGILKRANEVGVLILDVMMPGVNGLDVLTEIKKTDPEIGIIMLTGHSSKDVAIEALQGRADDFIEKPMVIERIKSSVERLMARRNKEPDISDIDIKGKMEKVKKFIEKNCFKKISLKEAAAAVFLSPKYLSRIFKEQTRTGFSEYKLRIKIAKSKELLAKSAYNVNQISEKLGYENAESFIRQFKKLAHYTPTEYRNKIKRDKKRSKAKRALN